MSWIFWVGRQHGCHILTLLPPMPMFLSARLYCLRRDELAADIADLQKRINDGTPAITQQKIETFAALLRDKLRIGTPELKQAYARLVMTEVTVMENPYHRLASDAG